ncbi:MAG: oligosaccharide flippase family protein [Bacteroidales bacterium]|jgi:PST family polysaccharide transporter|nr:oligosaccharide flippase family protein [Bacteroidales bacterium]OQB64815.1 MAG: putative O-antigen transporter [Bacteroidetes bacterium ADurb.Bin145]HOU03054.1 oligosaccharide flippase family protein [Bacteroidales bacterium]HQK66775.1 oligosaccharide flippase family protein [Bacteroidales bacterium]
MIKRIQNVLVENKVVLVNFSFLGILQLTNLIIFIILIPYLYRILGKENYGLVVFAQTVALYFSIIVNYGFNVTATRDISVNRDNQIKRSEIISYVLAIKILFFVISSILLSLLIFTLKMFKDHPALFYFSMLACLSEALFPVWYFQGIERMKYITVINIIVRIASASFLFIFIKEQSDYFLVPLFLGSGTLLGALAGLYIVFVTHRNNFILAPVSFLIGKARENFPVFISNISSQIYVNANKIIIGALAGVREVAQYDIAERLVSLAKVPFYVLGQALFPEISRKKNIRYINKITLIVSFLSIVIAALIIIMAPLMVTLMTGYSDENIVTALRVLILSVIPVTIGLFYTDLRLIPFEYYSDFAKTRVLSLIVYSLLVLLLLMTKLISIVFFAWTIVGVEVFVVMAAYYFCNKRRIC